MLSLRPWRRGSGGCTVSPALVHRPDAAALRLRDINRTASDLVQDVWKKGQKNGHISCRNTTAASAPFDAKCVKCSHESGEVAEVKNWRNVHSCCKQPSSALKKKWKQPVGYCQFQSHLFILHKSQSVKTTCCGLRVLRLYSLAKGNLRDLGAVRRFLDVTTDQETVWQQHLYGLSVCFVVQMKTSRFKVGVKLLISAAKRFFTDLWCNTYWPAF